MTRNQLLYLASQLLTPGASTELVRRDERGLSQSTENAVLLAGAVAVAAIVITAVTSYVSGHMPR